MRRSSWMLLSLIGLPACAPSGPALTCADLGNGAPKGRQVELRASVVGFTMSVSSTSDVTKYVWACRDVGVQFGFVNSDADWTEAASKANNRDSTFVVTGIVGDSASVDAGGSSNRYVFIRKVHVRLESEAPVAGR